MSEDYVEIKLEMDSISISLKGNKEYLEEIYANPKEKLGKLVEFLWGIKSEPRLSTSKDAPKKIHEIDMTDWKGKIAADAKVTPEFIRDRFEHTEEGIILVDWAFESLSDGAKKRQIGLLLAYANSTGLDTDSVGQKFIIKICKEFGVGTSNMNRDLLTEPGLRSAGSKKYAINVPGKKKVRELLVETETALGTYADE